MKKLLAVAVALALLGLSIAASAAITIETVTVGDLCNAADKNGFGSVSYTYNIGKYEVTAGQYCAFLNAVAKKDTYGLYCPYMGDPTFYWGCNIQRVGDPDNYTYSVPSDWANRPVNYVSFWSALRFANWLHNGQPIGEQDLTTTEDGAYFINGYNGEDGREIQRKSGAKWAITSEDEWYKAAYYKGGGTNAGYWLYPTRSDSVPSNDLTNPDGGNNANYYIHPGRYTIDSPYYRTNVGEFEDSESAYGTFDQGGNLWEWNEGIAFIVGNYAARSLRGGSFANLRDYMQSTFRTDNNPMTEDNSYGFRVVQLCVPEPSSIIAWFGGLTGLIGARRRTA